MNRIREFSFILPFIGFLGFLAGNTAPIDSRVSQSGPEVVQLTSTGNAYWAVWSPGGMRIAYFTRLEPEEGWASDQPLVNLWVMNRDGSELRRLWDGQGVDRHARPSWPPSWSYDERYIAVDRSLRGSVVIDVDNGVLATDSIFTDAGIIARFSPHEPFLTYARRIWEHDERRTLRSDRLIFALNTQTGETRTVHETGYQSESGYEEFASVWSLDGKVLRIQDHWHSSGRPFFFYDINTGEKLLQSGDPRGGSELSDNFPSPRISRSGKWQVVSPRIDDSNLMVGEYGGFLFRSPPLRVSRIPEAGEGRPAVPAINLSEELVLSYSWHPEEDLLLYSTVKKSSDSTESDIYTIYLARF